MTRYCYRLSHGIYYCYGFNSTHRRAAFLEVMPEKYKMGLAKCIGRIDWQMRDKFTEYGEVKR